MSCSRTQHGGGRSRTPDLSLRSPTLYHWATALPRYQMQSITIFYEKRWKQQSKRWRWESQPAWITYVSAQLVQAGGEAMIDILTTICNKIWKTGEWPTTWTQSLVITLPKKGNLQLCQNYRTISLLSHPSKVMLKIILNRFQPPAEEIIAEEQAGFRAGRSTTEQIFNFRTSARNTCSISWLSTMSS